MQMIAMIDDKRRFRVGTEVPPAKWIAIRERNDPSSARGALQVIETTADFQVPLP